MRALTALLLVSLVALALLPSAHAFGAGNIPAYSYLEDKAFRHGDIEDIIATMFKAASGGFLSRGTKFTPLDVKRVYFGNWLRDYSQAVDVGALKKTNLQTILNVVMVLGFLAHGYVTAEFEVTSERLGCYLPTEHIDNPKGYADGEDARKYDPRLRGPVDPRELEIDPATGMKNYIANENGAWATSKALVRETLTRCINMGRRFKQSSNKDDQYEAFRLLGQALHTLEDFSAHSNWCELALISFGYHNVFPHVGQNVKIRTPQGRQVHPLVTGTFGGADFIHSLMGEATDHLSQASVSDFNTKMASARSAEQSAASSSLRQLLFDLPGGGDQELTREMDGIQNMRAGQPGGIDPSTMSPQDLHRVLWQILSFRDSVMKKIENTIDRIPGLGSLVEKVSNSVAVFIITTLEPFVKPLMGTAVGALGQSSQAVIDSHDQYEVWNDWNASDPTHSFLSKDHFGLILNEPAGEVAKIVVQYTVERVVKAWDDTNIAPTQISEDVLQCLFHPDFMDGRSQIQRMMMDRMRAWIDTRGSQKNELLNRLTSESVRAGKNKRIGDNSSATGHVHNHLLPEGGLQAALASHNVHVPGAQVLNAGQDLLGGKKPWDQGFGSGGAHAWRELDPSATQGMPSQAPYGSTASPSQPQDFYGAPSQSPYPPPSHSSAQFPSYDPQPSGGYPGQHAGFQQAQGYAPNYPPQAPPGFTTGYAPPGPPGQYGYEQQGYPGQEPAHGHGHGHPPGHHGQYEHQGHHAGPPGWQAQGYQGYQGGGGY
ncbi:hypothetical protein Q5752_002870 [Cryptotrichosporon argae]